MGYPEKKVAAVFCLRQPFASIEDAAAALGAAVEGRDDLYLYCKWADLHCAAEMIEAAIPVLMLRFWQSSFYEIISPEHPPAATGDPITRAFGESCARLGAVAGFIVTNLYHAEWEWIEERLQALASGDLAALDLDRPGLLFLSDEYQRQHGLTLRLEDRDSLSIPGGLLIYAGRGEDRWF